MAVYTSTYTAAQIDSGVAKGLTVPTVTSSDNGKILGVANGALSALQGVPYITTAPSAANTSGTLIIVVLSSEPATKYDGYLYLITGA